MAPNPPGADTGSVTVRACAKINLYLHVAGKRADGYHELDSLIVFAGTGDVVVLESAGDLTFNAAGPRGADVPPGDDNLVMKAARTLAAHANVRHGARIVLEKHLPAASGIGGGSADAAAALIGLRALWGLDIATQELCDIGLALGADVPICVHGQAAFVGGIGEVFAPVPALPPCWFVLANPGVPVETARVFARRTGAFSAPAPFRSSPEDAAAFAALLRGRRNDLAEPAQAIAPVIGDALRALESCDGALLARMSGSGATCFALFGTEAEARAAARHLRQRQSGWWIEAAPLLSDTAGFQG
ncbi:MAG: 4-(cytidine 5'-diphospho)-2-C-methyl-D-erythritol kinase [Rhodospirillales bacterium]